LASAKAERQSIMGAPVLSRSSFTIAAEIVSVTVDILLFQPRGFAFYWNANQCILCKELRRGPFCTAPPEKCAG
jgi:hypothetical protein